MGTKETQAMSRRRFFRLVAVTGSALALGTACGATPTATPAPPTATKPPAPTAVPAAPTATKPAPAPTSAPAPAPTSAPAPAATATKAPSTTGQSGGLMRMATAYGHSRIVMMSGPQRPYFYLLHDMLFDISAKTGELIPRLAEKYSWSADGKTLTIAIRPNAKFHDGKPVTAKDVIFSWSVGADVRTGTDYSSLMEKIVGYADVKAGKAPLLTGMKAVNDKTVEVTLTGADPLFLHTMASQMRGLIWPSYLLENEPRDKFKEAAYWWQPVGAGPFKLAKYTKDQRMEVERFDDFWAGKPLLEKINIEIITDANARIAAYEKGSVDLIFGVAIADAVRLGKGAGSKVIGTWRGRADSLDVNHKSRVKGLGDPAVKRAMMYAIDRETLVNTLYGQGQGARPIYSIIMDEWARSTKPNPYKFDPAMAKKLLADAKWDASQEVRITASSSDRAALATAIQQYFADVGIKSSTRTIDSATEEALQAKGDLDLNFSAEGVSLVPEGLYNYVACPMAPPAGLNTSFYCNSKADAVWDQIRANTDMSKRASYFQQLDDLYREDPVWIPVLETAQQWVFSNKLNLTSDTVSWQWCQMDKWGFV